MDGEAVKASLERVMNAPDVNATLKDQLSIIEEVSASDDQVTITLEAPSNSWLYQMTGPAGIVFDPASLESSDAEPAGSGPFEFEEWESGSHLRLRRSDDYWGEAPAGRPSEVVFRYYANPNSMITAMLSDQLDMISNLTVPDSIDTFEDPRFEVSRGDTMGEVLLGINHRNETLSDPDFRKPMAYAINREELVDAAWGGLGRLIGSMVPPTDPWFEEDLVDEYPHDPAKAREILAEVALPEEPLRLRVPSLPYAVTSARFVASSLRDVGIQVDIEELEFSTWLEVVYTQRDYDLTIVSHVEPRDIVKFASGDNLWGYSNEDFDHALQLADQGDEDVMVEEMKRAARILSEDVASMWLFLLPNIVIARDGVTGYNVDATSLSFDLTRISVDG